MSQPLPLPGSRIYKLNAIGLGSAIALINHLSRENMPNNENLCYVCGLRGQNIQVANRKCNRCLTLEDVPRGLIIIPNSVLNSLKTSK